MEPTTAPPDYPPSTHPPTTGTTTTATATATATSTSTTGTTSTTSTTSTRHTTTAGDFGVISKWVAADGNITTETVRVGPEINVQITFSTIGTHLISRTELATCTDVFTGQSKTCHTGHAFRGVVTCSANPYVPEWCAREDVIGQGAMLPGVAAKIAVGVTGKGIGYLAYAIVDVASSGASITATRTASGTRTGHTTGCTATARATGSRVTAVARTAGKRTGIGLAGARFGITRVAAGAIGAGHAPTAVYLDARLTDIGTLSRLSLAWWRSAITAIAATTNHKCDDDRRAN